MRALIIPLEVACHAHAYPISVRRVMSAGDDD